MASDLQWKDLFVLVGFGPAVRPDKLRVTKMRPLLLMIFVLAVPVDALGKDQEVPQQLYNELSSDLSSLHNEVIEAQRRQQTADAQLWLLEKLKVSKEGAPIHVGASDNAKTLTKASVGETFRVIDKAEDWYAVQLNSPTSEYTAGWIRAADTVPLVPSKPQALPQTEDIYDKLLKRVNAIKERYNDNQYITVTGFSVDIGISPSVSISFEFKK